jgi:hypothetical protein
VKKYCGFLVKKIQVVRNISYAQARTKRLERKDSRDIGKRAGLNKQTKLKIH